MKPKLLEDITPNSTIIYVEDAETISNFDPAGGVVYIGWSVSPDVWFPSKGTLKEVEDYFLYTSIEENKFLGCSNLNFVHLAGEPLSKHYGQTIKELIAPLELSENQDPDGVLSTILDIIDSQYSEIKFSLAEQINHSTNPNFCHNSHYGYIIKSNGLEYDEDVPEELQQMLALSSAEILQNKGEKSTFEYLIYCLTEYETEVKLETKYTPFFFNETYGFLYEPMTLPAVTKNTLGLWHIDNAPNISVPNEIDGGYPLVLSGVGLWETTQGCSMFDKDEIIKVKLPAEKATISYGRDSRLNLKNKNGFCIEVLLKSNLADTVPIFKSDLFKLEILPPSTPTGAHFSIKATVFNDTDSIELEANDVLVPQRFEYIAIRYKQDEEFVLVVNENIEDYSLTPSVVVKETLGSWEFGGDEGDFAFDGSFDFIKISNSVKHIEEFSSYYEHIRKGRTSNLCKVSTDRDWNASEYSFFNHPAQKDGLISVQIVNDDGNMEKHKFVSYLIEEHLGSGNNSLLPGGQLALELMTGFA